MSYLSPMLKPLPLLLIAGLALAACGKPPPEAAPKAASAAPEATPTPAATPVPPPDQAALVKQIAADDPAFCPAFQQTRTFDNWIVTVDDVETSTVNSSIDITFNAGSHVRLEEVVQTSDPVYPAVAQLHIGRTARLSGRFSHGNGECSYRLDKVGVIVTGVS